MAESVEIKAALLLRRIAVRPPADSGAVESAAIVKVPRLVIAELRGEPERILIGKEASGTQEFAKAAIFVSGDNRAGSTIEQCCDIATSVVAHKAIYIRTAVACQHDQPSDATGPVHGAAEVLAPEERLLQDRGIKNGQEVPAIVNEAGIGIQRPRAAIPMLHDFLDPAALAVVGELQPEPVRSGDARNVGHGHTDKSILAIPLVAPNAVEAQIAVQIVSERLAVGWERQAAFVGGASRGNGDVLPKRSVGVADADLPVEVLDLAVSRSGLGRYRSLHVKVSS